MTGVLRLLVLALLCASCGDGNGTTEVPALADHPLDMRGSFELYSVNDTAVSGASGFRAPIIFVRDCSTWGAGATDSLSVMSVEVTLEADSTFDLFIGTRWQCFTPDGTLQREIGGGRNPRGTWRVVGRDSLVLDNGPDMRAASDSTSYRTDTAGDRHYMADELRFRFFAESVAEARVVLQRSP